MTDTWTENPPSTTTSFHEGKKVNEYELTTLVIILIAVSGALFLFSLVVTTCAFVLRKQRNKLLASVNRQDSWANSLNEEIGDAKSKNGLVVDDNLAIDVGASTKESIYADLARTLNLDKSEEQEQIYSFNVETNSIGLNTVARREHKLDKQMQKMQQLFQAFGDELGDSKTTVHTIIPSEELSQDSAATTTNSNDPYPATSSVTKPDDGYSKVTHNSNLYPSITVSPRQDDKNGKLPLNGELPQNGQLLQNGKLPQTSNLYPSLSPSSKPDEDKSKLLQNSNLHPSILPSINPGENNGKLPQTSSLYPSLSSSPNPDEAGHKLPHNVNPDVQKKPLEDIGNETATLPNSTHLTIDEKDTPTDDDLNTHF